ncbi:YihY family inner membrane protein [Helicobacter gastrocanis]|uniref:YihY family inner membrane protein n=1 Tax=Helicobacter gastrocanis TaxID=2849641 RepID=UPI001C84BCA2|nr:YihY family inner membrane protein [Helicobacter sp. NHP19-003]
MPKRFLEVLAQIWEGVLGLIYACENLISPRLKHRFEEMAVVFYYASSLSFYTILSLSPILLFVALVFVSPFAETFSVEKLFLPDSPDFMKMTRSFLKSFTQNNRTLGFIEITSIAIAFFLFCENYRYIASKIFNAEPRDYFNFKGRRIFVFWGFGTGIVFILVLPLILFYDLQVQNLTKGWLLSLLHWLGTYLFFYLLFIIPTNKSFKHPLTPLFWSFITSVCWNLMKWGFVYYVLFNRTYHELYGSVSILWFLMSYIYVSWLLLLFGMYACAVRDEMS